MSHHREQDHQSLMLHTAAVKLMQDDSCLVDRALNILDRWCQQDSKSASLPLWGEWQKILRARNWDLALSVGEKGCQLRQASPVSCVLPNKQRLEIIRSCKKRT